MKTTIFSQSAALLLALVVGVAQPAAAWAWHAEGHELVVQAGLARLPTEMPAFFREGVAGVSHVSVDSDAFRDPTVPQLTRQEGPEHYLDVEYLSGRPLPADRMKYLALLRELDRDPAAVGFLPYAVTEWTQRLTIAFAEHRRFPEDPVIRMKCLVYAGFVAHYAADLCQPLHTTVHFDGRMPDGGKSPRSGIHELADALPGRLGLRPADLPPSKPPAPMQDLLPEVWAELLRSHAQVDRVYQLESDLRATASGTGGEAVQAFARERMAAAANLTARLCLTAWTRSQDVKLEDWLVKARLRQAE